MMAVAGILTLALIGLTVGLLGGLLGIGGGLVTVPSFLYFFYYWDYSHSYSMQVAIGTSLGVMVFTAGSSAWSHYLKNGIQWTFLRNYAPGVALGAIFGALIADYLPSGYLELFFGSYAFLSGVRFLIDSRNKYRKEKNPVLPSPLISLGMGLFTGTVSSSLGVGGAMFTIPFLTWYHLSLRKAISTSSLVGLMVAVIGSISFMCFGLDAPINSGSIGYMFLPGFFITGLTSMVTAPLGAKLAYILPVNVLKKVFGVFLIIVGLVLICP